MPDVMDYISTQLEQVGSDVVDVFRAMQSDFARDILTSAQTHKVSRYLYRHPLKKWHGGNVSKISGNAGVFPVGLGPSYTEFRAGYFYSMRAYNLTDEMIDTMQSGEQAVVDVMSDYLAGAMNEVALDDECSVFSDGTGKLTNGISTVTSTTVIVFAGSTDTLGVGRLREGQPVDIWNSAGSAQRSPSSGSAPTYIKAIDYPSRTVTLNQAMASMAEGDLLVFPGMAAYGPASLTTGATGWPPAVADQVAAGLGGDSFRHGIYYIDNSGTATYYLGVLKSTIPNIVAKQIAAGGAALDWSHSRLLQDAVMTARGINSWEVRGIVNPAQRYAFENLGINITSIAMTGAQNVTQNVDLASMNRDMSGRFTYGGLEHDLSPRQYTDRIDYIERTNLHRAVLTDPEFVPGGDGGGKYLWRDRDATTARPKKSYSFYIQCCYDIFHVDPGLCGYIDGLQVPDGYAGGSGTVYV